MRRVFILLAGTFIILLAACDDYKIPVPPCAPDSDPTTEVSFTSDLEPFFESKCNSCHGGTYSPDLSKGWAYDELMDGGDVDVDFPCESNLYQVVSGNHGTHGAVDVSDEEKTMVLDWIQEGAEQ